MQVQTEQVAEHAQVGSHAGAAGEQGPDRRAHGPGAARVEQLMAAGAPAVDELAALVAAYPGERGAILALVHGQLGNGVAARLADGALPASAEPDPAGAAHELVGRGLVDDNALTDELFWRCFPALRGLALLGGTPAAAEWMRLREQVARPALRGRPSPHEEAPAELTIEPAPPTVAPAEESTPSPATEVASGADAGPIAHDQAPQPLAAPPAPVAAPEPEVETPRPVVERSAPATEVGEAARAAPDREPPAPTSDVDDREPQAPKAAAGPAPFPDPRTIGTKPAEAQVLNDLRMQERRFEPTWLLGLQHALGAEATGAMNTSTLRKLQQRGADAGLKPARIFDEAFLTSLHPGSPFFVPDAAHRTRKTVARESANERRNRTARHAGRADFAAWQSEWVDIKLLDVTLGPGHPVLAARVEAASAFLRARHAGMADPDIRKQIGWASGEGNAAYFLYDLDMHNMGLAIDIAPSQNAWFFRGEKTQAHDDWNMRMFKEAARIFGGAAITPGLMHRLAETRSTEELWAIIHESSESIARYLSLCKRNRDGKLDEARFKRELHGVRADLSDAQIEAAYRFAIEQEPDRWFHDANLGQQDSRSITNHSEELLVALRDAGGLAWGGAEISGSVNGDFMHFDLRGTGGAGGQAWEMIAHILFGSGLSRPERDHG